MTSLLQELKLIINVLNDREIPYALCGGLALAVHGIARATIDIDFVIPESALSDTEQAMRSLGFDIEANLQGFHGGRMGIKRLTKIYTESGNFLSVDILYGDSIYLQILEDRQLITLPTESIWVLSPKSLIAMKEYRNSDQDKVDIQNLQRLIDEN